MKKYINNNFPILFRIGDKVKVVGGSRIGLTGLIIAREYIEIIRQTRWRVEFDNNMGEGLIAEWDIEKI